MTVSKKKSGAYSAKEAERRFKAALQGLFDTPAKPSKSIKPATKKRNVTGKRTAK
jgi:hypothetical protein